MSVSPLLAVPAADAGYELLGRLGDMGWSISIVPHLLAPDQQPRQQIVITARRGERQAHLECRSVAEGALELFERLRWL